MVSTREGIGRGKFCTGEDFSDNIKVLQKERPVSLSARTFVGVFNICRTCFCGW